MKSLSCVAFMSFLEHMLSDSILRLGDNGSWSNVSKNSEPERPELEFSQQEEPLGPDGAEGN